VRPFPLYKGATRAAVVWGVPLVPLVGMVIGVAVAALALGLWWWGLVVPLWALMARITRTDDRAFRILGLWLATKCLNGWRLALGAGREDFWGASSYALGDGNVRPWKAEGRWGG
jgi:type IV secretion system protein VirB3